MSSDAVYFIFGIDEEGYREVLDKENLLDL